MPNEQDRVEVYIQEDMDVSKCSWLVAIFEHEKGIVSAWFERGNHHCLTILYERKHFSHITLIDTIKMHGFHGKIL